MWDIKKAEKCEYMCMRILGNFGIHECAYIGQIFNENNTEIPEIRQTFQKYAYIGHIFMKITQIFRR